MGETRACAAEKKEKIFQFRGTGKAIKIIWELRGTRQSDFLGQATHDDLIGEAFLREGKNVLDLIYGKMDRSEKYAGYENDLILHRHLKFS